MVDGHAALHNDVKLAERLNRVIEHLTLFKFQQFDDRRPLLKMVLIFRKKGFHSAFVPDFFHRLHLFPPHCAI